MADCIVKPRFDGKDLEGFANMHRNLSNKELMFDVDRVFADITFNMSMRKENELFVEYNLINNRIIFKALFEVKYKKTPSSLEALDKEKANSRARAEMCKKLGARLFVVYQTNGKVPFEFNEVDVESGELISTNILNYQKENAKTAWINFWKNTLKM